MEDFVNEIPVPKGNPASKDRKRAALRKELHTQGKPADGQAEVYNEDTGRLEWSDLTGAGAPNTVDFLVGTANAILTNEIVVGTTPGGELGGTWPSPTVDATHSGSAHHAAESGESATHNHGNLYYTETETDGLFTTHEALPNVHHTAFVQADADALYEPLDATIVRTTDTDWVDLTDAGETALHSHAGGSGDVATDAIWDAAGDLARGSGADTAARLATGAAGTVLIGGTSWSASPVIGTALILGSADTSGIRFDIESGVFAVREGDDSAYASVVALTYNTGAGPVTNPLVKFIANATETIAANIAGYEFSPTLTTSGNSRAVYGVYAAPAINVANASSGHEIFGLRFTPTISGAGASASLVRIGAIDANASLASVSASRDISATEIYGLKMGSLGELGLGNFDAAGAIALSSTAALADVTVTTAYGLFNNGVTLQALNSGLITVTTAYGDFNGGFWMEVLGTGNVLVTTGYASFIRAPQMSAAVSTGNTTITTYEALHIGGGAYADADFTIGASTQLRIEDMTGARITGNNRLLEIGTSTPTTTSGLFRMIGNFTAAANQTPLYVSEGATPTVRQFRTKDGAAITGGDLVVVLV
jgi:hypothetical protein